MSEFESPVLPDWQPDNENYSPQQPSTPQSLGTSDPAPQLGRQPEPVQPSRDSAQDADTQSRQGQHAQAPSAHQYQAPAAPQPPKKKKKGFKRFMLIVLFAVLGYAGYSLYKVFVAPDRNIQQIYLVPKDAAFIIQSTEPVKDWQRFSSSEPWKKLKSAESFAEIGQGVEMLDSIIHANKTLLALVGKRDLLISVHKTRTTEFDFLILVDLQKVSKLNALKDQIENILKLTGGTVTNRRYNGVNIIEMRDAESHDVMYSAFIDNHFAVSFTSRLIEAAIDERENPQIGLEHAFIEVDKLVANKGLARVFVNYAYLPQFLAIYLGERNEFVDMFANSMDFAGLFLNSEKDKMEVKGYTLLKDVADPYVAALMHSGKQKMRAHEIMSARTALYANMSFDNPSAFVKELEAAMSVKDKATYDSYKSARKKIENYFNISLDEHFLGWMAGEFAFAQSEPGLLGREAELILAVRAKDIKDARKGMEYIEKRIRGRTPIKIKSVDYKDYQINYIEMKGFFRLFFGGLFDKFEKPYYTYVEDYVIFSNKSSSILSFIEDHEQKNLMKDDAGFKKAYSQANNTSTIFAYVDMPKFFPLLQPMLNASTWADLQKNSEVLKSFPQWVFQVVGDKQVASMQFTMDYLAYEEPVPDVPVAADAEQVDELDEAMDENAESEKELMNELERFYVEKFQGNVLREYYESGALKSESETRDGKRHGRYREFYEDGTLRLRGKYVNNRPKGTWKYYTQEGKFDRKEKHR